MNDATLPRYELLIGAAEFWQRAQADMDAAQRRVLVQAMTFEADGAGRGVTAAIVGASAIDRRVLVDDYSRNVINDTLLPHLPFRPAAVKREARETLAMFAGLRPRGVGVRITNPVLGNPLRYPLRNHKKLLVIDDAAYVGGINFSDHNFAWHDLMLRIEHPGAADFLAADFDRDWAGRPAAASAGFGDLALATVDGTDNPARLASLLARIAGARRSLDIVCAYPTMPFTAAFAAAARGGARVELFTPATSNKALISDYNAGAFAGTGVSLRRLREMTHAKAVLIDGETLLLGSNNFNFASYRTNGEILAEVGDPGLIADFTARILAPLRAGASLEDHRNVPRWRQWRGKILLALADRVLARLPHGQTRAIDWPEQDLGTVPKLF